MKYTLTSLLLLTLTTAYGQHEQHQTKPNPERPRKSSTNRMADTTRPAHSMQMHDGMKHGDEGAMQHSGMDSMMMTHSFSRNLPMNRNGSGTSWHPDQTPMYAYMKHGRNGWMYMLHYSVFLRYTSQNFNNPGKRGQENGFNAPNWAMGMAQKNVGRRGLLLLRAMVSLDPLTVGNGGYPLVFQSGEAYRGRKLVDRQHPHDLISELAVGYTHAFSRDVDLSGYVGYPGDPALGPPVFMHRISAFNLPDSPLSHHWQDATHITFGVATLGLRYKIFKLEGSNFTGREPDENRYAFDRPRFDSYSYRVSVNPTSTLALQFSQGWLKSPESLEPEEDQAKTMASLLHSKSLGDQPDRYITSAFVWGQNSHDGERDNSFLAESSLQWGRWAFFGRYENVMKSPHDLDLESRDSGFPLNLPEKLPINALTLGMNYCLAQFASTDLVLGALLTSTRPTVALEPFYGKNPLSGEVYLRFSPSVMRMMGMSMMNHKGGRMRDRPSHPMP